MIWSLLQTVSVLLRHSTLTCDGELPRAQVISRKKFLDKALAQLLELDPDCSVYVY